MLIDELWLVITGNGIPVFIPGFLSEHDIDEPTDSAPSGFNCLAPVDPGVPGKLLDYVDYTHADNAGITISVENDIFLAGLDSAGNFQWMCARHGIFQSNSTIDAPAVECAGIIPDGIYDGFLDGSRRYGILSWACIQRSVSN